MENYNEFIKILSVDRNKTAYSVNYEYSLGLSPFFNPSESFYIDYGVDISFVPESILVIPFVCSILPLVWLTNSVLIVDELDEGFFNSIPAFKQGYSEMFKESNFLGDIKVNKLIHNKINGNKKSALFYSGGADSIYSLIKHKDEDLDLLSIFGSDIGYYNNDGWNKLNQLLDENIKNTHFRKYVIHSKFRLFDNESKLEKRFGRELKDGWWHGVKHGIGIISHAAPLAYLFNYSTIYIASTYLVEDNIRCASHPSIDNNLSFFGVKVVHDGLETGRMLKLKKIASSSFVNTNNIKMHVCWESKGGANCCECEKCARTIYGLLVLGVDPSMYGFDNYSKVFSHFNRDSLKQFLIYNKHAYFEWVAIRNYFLRNRKTLKNMGYYNNIKWVRYIRKSYLKTTHSIKHYLGRIIKSAVRRIRVFFKRIKNRFKRFGFAISLKGYKAFIVGTPIFGNIGDIAILLSEQKLLANHNIKTKDITYEDYLSFKHIIIEKTKNKLVFLTGGGNMGDLWKYEENIRRDILINLKPKIFILFPQSIFFSNTSAGNASKEESKLYYSGNKRLIIFVREQYSFNTAKELYSDTKLFLIPDIVLYNKIEEFNKEKRHTIGLVLREDKEQALSNSFIEKITTVLDKHNLAYSRFDNVIDDLILSKDRNRQLSNKLDEYRSSSLIITDRLHGMIFSYITRTPCLVYDNSYHKIKGVYQWIKECPFIIFKDDNSFSFDDISKLMSVDTSQYTNDKIEEAFSSLGKIISDYAHH